MTTKRKEHYEGDDKEYIRERGGKNPALRK